MHTILDQIYEKMDRLLSDEKRTQGADTTLIFSYRAPGEDFICFFPTSSQACSFVQSKDDITDFLYYWQFPYHRNKAISGWVLETGTSDYTEKFDSDRRWNDWISACPDDEKSHIERQLTLVRKFFRTGQSQNLRFMYLVPIVLRLNNGKSATGAHQPCLRPILMASIGSSRPLAKHLREQIYDLAWQIAPAVEMALLGQMTLDEVYRKEAEINTVASFSAGFAHEVRQPLQLLLTKITSLRAAIETNPFDSNVREGARLDLEQARQSVLETQDFQNDMLEFVKLRQAGALQFAPLDVNSLLDELVKKFRSHCQVMREGKIQIEAKLTPGQIKITANPKLIRTMIRNLFSNADAALSKRDSGQIKVFTEVADGVLCINVQDDGPGMAPDVIEKLNRGERFSTRPMGIGLGFRLVDLSCQAHGGSYKIKSSQGLGTVVMLQLPVNGPAIGKGDVK